MSTPVSSMDEIMAALPFVQEAVRQEIAGRVAAGEFIAGSDADGRLMTSRSPYFDHTERRQQLVDAHAARLAALGPNERKSAV